MTEVSKEMRQYFRDVADHLRRLDEEIMVQRDLLDGALNANLGAISLRQNEIVRKVSGWAAIGIVPTLIASIYGMNFEHMPELRWGLGYPAGAAPDGAALVHRVALPAPLELVVSLSAGPPDSLERVGRASPLPRESGWWVWVRPPRRRTGSPRSSR